MSDEVDSGGFYQQIVFHVRETSIAGIEVSGEARSLGSVLYTS